MSIFAELRRRNVFRVAAAYVIVGWLIMQVGEVMAPALNLPDWILSALAFFIILGFPLAIIFAWAFEMTPEGLKLEKDVDRSSSITRVTGRKLDFTIIALLALALGYFVYDEFVVEQRPDGESMAEGAGQVRSIAVLPLADMSPQGDHEYFSDGLTEELLNILAKIKELQVAGRTSSFAFKGRNEDLREIGRKLNVDSILEGSVRKDDARNRVRITLQLINVDDGYHLWSETYDRDLNDIFAIQEEVAHEVAKALRITLLGEDEVRLDKVAKTEVDTYDLYLQGLQELHRSGYAQLQNAVDLFEQVLAKDPSYLPARLGLVEAYRQLANTGAITVREAGAKGLPLLQAILREQPGNSRAHALMGSYHSAEFDDEAAERSFLKALELDPRNVDALTRYGSFLFARGHTERGTELIDAALAIEPYASHLLWTKCSTSARLGLKDRALDACERYIELEPDSPQGYYGVALAWGYSGDIARMAKGYVDAIERDPGDYEMLAAMALFWADLGDMELSRQWLERAEAIGAGQPIPLLSRILFYQYQERDDLAAELAAHALAQDLDDRHGSQFNFRHVNSYYLMRAGQPEKALEPYMREFPWVFDEPFVTPNNLGWLVDDLIVIAALMQSRDPMSGRWQELLNISESNTYDYHPAWGPWHAHSRLARIHAIRGAHVLAITELKKAVDMGMRLYWRNFLLYDPALHSLKPEPEFQNLVAFLERDMDRQREVAYQLMGISK